MFFGDALKPHQRPCESCHTNNDDKYMKLVGLYRSAVLVVYPLRDGSTLKLQYYSNVAMMDINSLTAGVAYIGVFIFY